MEISLAVYIIASIHQEMQFARLPGSVVWRTACNCLSHHLQKKNLKSNYISDDLDTHERKRGPGAGREAVLFILLVILFPLDVKEICYLKKSIKTPMCTFKLL